MAETSICCNWITFPALLTRPHFNLSARKSTGEQQRWRKFRICASKSGGFSPQTATKSCQTCGGKGAIECPGCKGTGKNKKNGNIFERWKCFDCQGFGLKSCPKCGKGGLTPEQRGER